MQVTRADAAEVKAAVISAGGVSSRGVLRHLAAVVSAVRSGGVKASCCPPLEPTPATAML